MLFEEDCNFRKSVWLIRDLYAMYDVIHNRTSIVQPPSQKGRVGLLKKLATICQKCYFIVSVQNDVKGFTAPHADKIILCFEWFLGCLSLF